MTPYAFSIIGGDTRLCWLAQYLAQAGHIVKIYGHEENDFVYEVPVVHCCDLETVLDGSHACILGMPSMQDNDTVSAPYSRKKISYSKIIDYMSPTQILFGGILPQATDKIRIFDYAKDESLLLYNAIPTAEGALQLLMENTPYVIHGSKIAVVGFGRIGQKTANLLVNMGAIVDIYTRNPESQTKAEVYGCHAKPIAAIVNTITSYHAVINTVPSPIFTSDILSKADKNTVFMELASAPGGFDLSTVKNKNLIYILANGLPGKVAPQSAAKYIQKTILKRMEEII